MTKAGQPFALEVQRHLSGHGISSSMRPGYLRVRVAMLATLAEPKGGHCHGFTSSQKTSPRSRARLPHLAWATDR